MSFASARRYPCPVHRSICPTLKLAQTNRSDNFESIVNSIPVDNTENLMSNARILIRLTFRFPFVSIHKEEHFKINLSRKLTKIIIIDDLLVKKCSTWR